MDMLIQNHQSIILDFMTRGARLVSEAGFPDATKEIENAKIEAESKDKEPVIMFYGLYNAGKSTLINALCKKEIAEVGDVPTTAAIQTVPWSGYHLIDTPGINANGEHTKAAQEMISKSDLVLFIVDNMDGFEREMIYEILVDIIKSGKAVVIVVNQKYINDDDDLEHYTVPQLPSMMRIVDKITYNLEQYGRKNNIKIDSSGMAENFV